MSDTNRIEEGSLGKFDSRLVEITVLTGLITFILTIIDIFIYEKTNISARKQYLLGVLLLTGVTLLCILICWHRKIILANIGGLVVILLICLLFLCVNYTIYAGGNLTSILSVLKSLIVAVVVVVVVVVVLIVLLAFGAALSSLYMPAGRL